MNYSFEGLILKSFSSGEFDRIYWAFGREKGKISFLAKGARKPLAKLASGLEPLTQAEIFLVQGKKLDRVVGVVPLNQFKEIRQNLEKNLRARSLLELLFYLEMEEGEADLIYRQLEKYFSELNRKDFPKEKIDLLSLGALWKIIFFSGWGGDFYHCSGCGKRLKREEINFFCFGRGAVCEACLKKDPSRKQRIQMSEELVKILRFFGENDLLVFRKLKVSSNLTLALKKLTKAYLDEIIGKKLLDLWF